MFSTALNAATRITTIVIPHPASLNHAREMVGQFYSYETQTPLSHLAITSEFTRSFRPDRIAQCFFGDSLLDDQTTLTISGSRTNISKDGLINA
jgi:hypothetical protein